MIAPSTQGAVPSTSAPPSAAPPPSRHQLGRIRRLIASPIGVIVAIGAGLLLVDAGGTDDGPGLCVFRRCTGGYCPGCGLSRATRHLSRGEVSASWRDHPWVLLAAAQAVVLTAVWAVARRRSIAVSWLKPVQFVIGLNVVLVLGIWVVRLIDGSIPRFF
ncbi:MAG: DUF2752 domain-containing protein [Ilumatobacter sp.]